MKIDAIKLNTSYYMPNKGSTLSSFRGDAQAVTLPAQGNDVVQFKDKTEPATGENAAQDDSKRSTIHNMYQSLKRFFTVEPNTDMDFDDLDMVIYRSLTY